MFQIGRFRSALATAIGLVSCASFAKGGPPAPGVYTADPPPVIKTLLDRLEKGENPAPIVQSLNTLEAAPYLRASLDKSLHRRDLNEALARIEEGIYEQNRKQYKKWIEEGRLDLCAELVIACPENYQAPDLQTLPFHLEKRFSLNSIRWAIYGVLRRQI
jgi:hypothetical protein